MEPIQSNSGTAGKSEIRKGRWPCLGLMILALSVMLVSVKACPGDIQVRSTNAVTASLR